MLLWFSLSHSHIFSYILIILEISGLPQWILQGLKHLRTGKLRWDHRHRDSRHTRDREQAAQAAQAAQAVQAAQDAGKDPRPTQPTRLDPDATSVYIKSIYFFILLRYSSLFAVLVFFFHPFFILTFAKSLQAEQSKTRFPNEKTWPGSQVVALLKRIAINKWRQIAADLWTSLPARMARCSNSLMCTA